MQFRILDSSHRIDNGIEYIKNILNSNPDCIISIGCDSQNSRKYCAYVTAIAFRYPGLGAHVIYQSHHVPKIKDKFSRLWKETEESVEMAKVLKENDIQVDAIELDFNKVKTAGSNMMVAPSVGYVVGLGFKALTKPDELIAVRAADYILRR